MENEYRLNLFFSEKQKKRQVESAELLEVSNFGRLGSPKPQKTFGELENGEIVEYTEAALSDKPSSNFDDFIYLGKGKYHHSESY